MQSEGQILSRRSRRSAFLENTLKGIGETLERSLFAEEISARPGFFQSIDARVKEIVILALILSVSFSRSLPAIAALYGVIIVLALLSRIPLGFFVSRVWLTLPFFTAPLIIPALFITPGPPLFHLPMGLIITSTGVTTSAFLLMRVTTSVSLTLLLILTTPWNIVLSALTVMRVPDVVILIIGMTYRYIYLLLRIANDMFLSRQSRVVGHLSTTDEQRILGATAATLLNRSLDLSSEVYLAMQSRGFRGSAVALKPFKIRPSDWLWGMLLILLAVAVSLT